MSKTLNNYMFKLLNMNETISDRIVFKITELGISRAQVARRANLNRASITHWVNGNNEPSSSALLKLSSALECSSEWLLFGKGSPDVKPETSNETSSDLFESNQAFVDVPVFDVELSAGNGSHVDLDHIVEMHPIHQTIFDKLNIPSNETAVVKVRGDSMEETLWHGDSVLVHTAIKKPISNKIYAFALQDELRVKRFSRQMDGSWRIISDNPDKGQYPDEIVSHHNIEKLRIIGHVIKVIDRNL